MNSDILDLVSKATQGDPDAFGKLYEIYSKEMYAYALCVTGNPHSAEDAVSEAVLSAFKQIKNLRKKESFKGWLFRILNAQCRRQYLAAGAHLSIEGVDPVSAGDGGIDNLELSLDLKNAVKILTPQEREIVFLKILGEYKSREIADMLDLPHATVRSKLARALAKLRNELRNDGREANDDE